jgi:cobalt-precorrin-5B (C1)-methyltransferase
MTSRKPDGPLRRGWTTGACATAGVTAAYVALLSGRFPDPVMITLPKGEQPSFALSRSERTSDDEATAAVIKDAGDDPDVTHGAEIIATVKHADPGAGVSFHAGDGVGTATLPGMPIDVGDAAINPVPRQMMRDAVAAVAAQCGGSGDVAITISVPGGEEMAAKTMNGRLGIKGGISILGTTGIVVPFSCASWIQSIHSGIDVARAAGLGHVAGATGRTSEAAVADLHGLAEIALIDMGDFAGGMLKYLRRNPVDRVTIAGGFAKISKLAAGHLDLHSSRSEVDFDGLAKLLDDLGAPAEAATAARTANTTAQVLETARRNKVDLAAAVATRAREVALATLAGGTQVDVAVFDRQGQLVGYAE